MITATDWYDPNPDLTQYEQGDIIKDVPYFLFPTHRPESEQPKWKLLRPRYPLKQGVALQDKMKQLPVELKAEAARNVPDRWAHPEGEYFVAAARKITVQIITRSCAIAKDSCVLYLVAPLTAIAQLPTEEKTQEKLEAIKNLDVFDNFYLPEYGELVESVSDLSKSMPVHWTFFGEKPRTESFVARLSSYGRSRLQALISDSFGASFGFDAQSDLCPQDGEYACSSCFYLGITHEVKRKRFSAGEKFGPCPKCGEKATWIKMPDAAGV